MYFYNITENLNFDAEEYYEGTPEYQILVDFISSIGGVL